MSVAVTAEVRVVVAMAVKEAPAASREVEPMEAPTPRTAS